MPQSPLIIGMVLFPQLTQLDLTGPYEVFSRLPNAKVLLLAPTLDPVASEKGLSILPDAIFADAPALDILFVPGGAGVNPLMEDTEFLEFLREKGQQARYVTSVCTGSLLLAAAGLLDGYCATTHWLSLDLLPMLGVETLEQRVVIDRNRITGAGVTAGIDLALVITAEVFGEGTARTVQLSLEYDPAPPFEGGSPSTASPDLVAKVRELRKVGQDQRREIVERILSKRRIANPS